MIANTIRALTANSAITGSLRKFYVGRMTALTTPRSAPGPDVISSTSLRKYVATVSQLVNMDENEME